MKLKYSLSLIILVLSMGASALEIDERLTMRIIKVSESRKTIMINRGVEDGLTKGDHAKFFLTIGVVARGVVVKVSPTRSVWSVYRLVNAQYIRDDQVMRLKITAPVKITKDESKQLVADDTLISVGTGDPRDLGIPLAEGADDLGEDQKIGLNGEVQELGGGFRDDATTSLREKNKEVFATFHYSGQSFSSAPSDDGGDFTGSETNMILNTGIEIYMKDLKKWYSRFSLVGMIQMSRRSAASYKGDVVEESTTEFGGGVNWYPLTRPHKVYKFIPFGTFNLLLGSTSTTFTPGADTTPSDSRSLDAGTFGYMIGGGVKYFTPRGYGAKVGLNFNVRADSYAADDQSTKWTKTNSGPVINVGFLYRF